MQQINSVSQSVSQSVNTLTTNLTLKHCVKWGIWEAIREIEANTLDVTGKLAKLNFSSGNLTISDSGRGIELKELMLLGVSHKEHENSIGEFGEGLKIAMIIFARLGYSMTVRAHDFLVKVSTVEVFGEQVLKYSWEFVETQAQGTVLTIIGISQEHVSQIEEYIKTKFISSESVKLFESKGESILTGNSLFVKNVFIQALENSNFSYNMFNLRLERDRSNANIYEIKFYMGKLISQIEDKELITKFFGFFRSDCLESQIEYFKPSEIWGTVFKELFGEFATVTTNSDILDNARYLGVKAIHFSSSDIVSGLTNLGIKTTEDSIHEKLSGKKTEITELNLEQKNVLETSISVIKSCTQLRFKPIKIYQSQDSILGYSPHDKSHIGISDKMLETYGDCLTTLIEELVHDNYCYSDGTPEFQVQFIREITKTLNVQGKVVFQAKLLRSKNHINGKDYFQYSIKIPSKQGSSLSSDLITVSIV